MVREGRGSSRDLDFVSLDSVVVQRKTSSVLETVLNMVLDTVGSGRIIICLLL